MCSVLLRKDIVSASHSTDRDINDLTALIKLGQLSGTDPCPLKPVSIVQPSEVASPFITQTCT